MITSCWAKLFGGIALFSMACAGTIMAQVKAPQTKGVYGGDVAFIAAISNGTAQTRLYLTTEGANSAFYGDVDLTQPDPFGTNLMFHVIPDMRASANHGAPNDMAFHQASGRIFFSDPQDGLLSCTTASNSITTNLSASTWALAIEGSKLVAVQWNYGTINFLFGTLSADGLTFTQSAGSPMQIVTGLANVWNVSLAVHPTNHQVYINWQGTNLVRSSDALENLSGATTFTPLVLPALTTNWQGGFQNNIRPFGFGPDGRIFVGGYNPANTNSVQNSGWEVIYSDDSGATWSPAIDGGSGSPLWSTVGDASAYTVYNGSSVSTNKGLTWMAFGTQVPGARIGHGRVVPDPFSGSILYCDTEGGLGVCTNGGSNWNPLVLHAGGVDVKDLLLTRENGAHVVYAGVANNNFITAYGIFKINPVAMTISHELTDSVNVQDLTVATNGALYASGFDTQTNVILYYKAAGAAAWTSVPLNGYSSNLMASSGGKPVIAVGRDAFSNEVPYLLGREWIFGTNGSETRCAIYYMTTEGTNVAWQTSDTLRYPMGTRINVIYWDDLVVGTDVGLYGQMFQPESTVTATALAGDFDGDRLADPAVYEATTGTWLIKLSSGNYAALTLTGFLGSSGYTALAADFDGDTYADPAVAQPSTGNWQIKLSSANYSLIELDNFLGGQ